jgi:two-component system, NarL family, response regulator NreC
VSTRILIADDHGVLRAGLRALLNGEEAFEVVGEAADGPSALDLALQVHPDVMLLDISMPGLGGIEVARQLKQALPDVRTLILTLHEDESLMREAIQAGASGYIVKRAVESELINAIHAVHNGNLYIHPTMTRALFRELAPAPRDSAQVESLSSRETDVLRLIAQGHTNRQIADILHLSVRTVETHRANILGKLGVSSRADLVRYAKEHNLMT